MPPCPARTDCQTWPAIDIAELQIQILAILEERGYGPEFRQCMNGSAQLGALLDSAGSAKAVLAEAIKRIRQRAV